MFEQRAARRFDLPFTIHFQIHGSAERVTHDGQVRDISHCGVYFFTVQEIAPGTRLDLTLRLPGDAPPKQTSVLVHAEGPVLRVERRVVNGREMYGIAVTLQKYEFARAAA